MADPEAPEPDVLDELLPGPDDALEDEDDTVLEVPTEVPEADALEQGRQPTIPSGSHLPHLTDDPEVPEADALEQAETFVATGDEDEDYER